MSIEQTLQQFAEKLGDAFGQHASAISEARTAAREAAAQFTIAQLGIGSLGTQIDDAEKRVMRNVDRLERKVDALLRAHQLNPEAFGG